MPSHMRAQERSDLSTPRALYLMLLLFMHAMMIAMLLFAQIMQLTDSVSAASVRVEAERPRCMYLGVKYDEPMQLLPSKISTSINLLKQVQYQLL